MTMTDNMPARPAMVLRSAEFRREREAGWRELEDLVTRVEKGGLGAISAEELQKLPLLYRNTLSSLSVARGIALDRNLLRYLEQLTLRAYLTVYGPRTGLWTNLHGFFTSSFPRYVRAAAWPILVTVVAFAVGILIGYLMVITDESWFSGIVPDELAGGRGPRSTAEDLKSGELFAPWQGFTESFIVFANSLFRHNSMVSILSFGLGLFAGVPTVLLIAYQGLVIGAFLALHANRGLLIDAIGWLSIHGVTEIAAILLCGAAGLVLAQTILFPGRSTRIENLARNGQRAAAIVGGAVAMLFVAGLIEGGFRQLIASTPWRFVFAGVTLVLWGLYFVYVGRGSGDELGQRSRH